MPGTRAVDDRIVGQRFVMLAAAVAAAAIAAATAPGAANRIPDWAAPQIATVVAHGLMGSKSVRTFRPNAALTRQTVADLAFGLQQQLLRLDFEAKEPTGRFGAQRVERRRQTFARQQRGAAHFTAGPSPRRTGIGAPENDRGPQYQLPLA